jgi:hypothetical protein
MSWGRRGYTAAALTLEIMPGMHRRDREPARLRALLEGDRATRSVAGADDVNVHEMFWVERLISV